MNDNYLGMDAAGLQRRLTEHDVVVLAVVADGAESGWFTVYLHGPAGNLQQETAFDLLITVPGVVEVRVSDRSPSILRVCQRPDALA
jgi:hypothetical protein